MAIAQGSPGRAEEGLAGIGGCGQDNQRRNPVHQGLHGLGHLDPAGPDRDGEQHDIGHGKAGHGHGAQEFALFFPLRIGLALRLIGRRRIADRTQLADIFRRQGGIAPPGQGQTTGRQVEAGILHARIFAQAGLDARDTARTHRTADQKVETRLPVRYPDEGLRIDLVGCVEMRAV